jgi:hypothetical protein
MAECPHPRTDRWPPSHAARLPAPVAAKAGSMPAHQGLGPDDCYRLEDRWIPTIELDEEQAIAIGQLYPPVHLAPEHDQLLSERGILGFKSALGPEECGEQVEEQQNQRDHHRKRDAILSSIQYGRGFRYTPGLGTIRDQGGLSYA